MHPAELGPCLTAGAAVLWASNAGAGRSPDTGTPAEPGRAPELGALPRGLPSLLVVSLAWRWFSSLSLTPSSRCRGGDTQSPGDTRAGSPLRALGDLRVEAVESGALVPALWAPLPVGSPWGPTAGCWRARLEWVGGTLPSLWDKAVDGQHPLVQRGPSCEASCTWGAGRQTGAGQPGEGLPGPSAVRAAWGGSAVAGACLLLDAELLPTRVGDAGPPAQGRVRPRPPVRPRAATCSQPCASFPPCL